MVPRQYLADPINVKYPLERYDHPDPDDSELLDADGIHNYLSLVGAFNGPLSWEDLIYQPE